MLFLFISPVHLYFFKNPKILHQKNTSNILILKKKELLFFFYYLFFFKLFSLIHMFLLINPKFITFSIGFICMRYTWF